MEKVEELAPAAANRRPLLAVSVIIAARNEGHNIARCLDSVREAGERYVVDSQSSDNNVRDRGILWRQGGSVSLPPVRWGDCRRIFRQFDAGVFEEPPSAPA